MRSCKALAGIILCLLPAGVLGQQLPMLYGSYDDLLPASPGALGNGLLGFVNPAVLPHVHGPDLRAAFVSQQEDLVRWGLFAAVPNVGFGMVEERLPGEAVRHYRLAMAVGDGGLSIGAGYGWSRGGPAAIWYGGVLARPLRFVSVGAAGWHAPRLNRQELMAELGLRPLGTDFLTLFADLSVHDRQHLADGRWSAGAAVQAFPGLYLVGRYFRGEAFSLGVNISLGRMGAGVQRRTPEGGGPALTTYSVRVGKGTPNVLDSYLLRQKCSVQLELKGQVLYQRNRFIDLPGRTLSELLFTLKDAAEDPRVAVVALNLSGLAVTPQLAWEIRTQLAQLRRAGKKVLVYIDRGSMTEYHLASVADRVVLDPEGMLTLQGYVAGRTFLKGTLEKLGLGWEEWRYFKYKSAAEVYSREQMSEADREQRQAWLNDQYELVRSEVCASRGMSSAQFDSLINNVVLFLPEEAVHAHLVDTLARWKDIGRLLKDFAGTKRKLTPGQLAKREYLPREWGRRPQVAVVYAIGECDLDRGIRARALERVLLRVAEKKRIKAVVLRVDSPGGDALASDLVAEAVRKCREKKPVIVSQGSVAGSGGYWLSMYGDSIVSTPATITGSIGVIGGWLWNKGLGDRLGMSSDHVQVGEHADLGFGITLPILGVQIPDRNLTHEEKARVEAVIRQFYRVFVHKVAQGRGMAPEAVEEIAQGRIWSGVAAKARGLVDEVGGLSQAVDMARARAGIRPGAEVEVVELPRPGLINVEALMPGAPSVRGGSPLSDVEQGYLRLLARYPAQPLLLMPLELQLAWRTSGAMSWYGPR
ncbi:MAG: S49 family peptidase [candidate division KSB1 bacterium]|nr:S49 family peptidase [candidate division KSB1 bacterium]